MSTFLVELRRSPLRWWFPFFLLMDLAAVFGRSHWWIGVWPQASAAGQIPSVFFAPLLAAGAVWVAGRRTRLGLEDQIATGTKNRWALEMHDLGITSVYAVVAYGIGLAAAALATVPHSGPGFLWPSYVLLGMSVIMASVGFGHVLGRIFPSAVSAPIIGGLAVFVFVAGVGSPNGLALFVLDGPPQVRLAPIPLIARISVAVSLVAAAAVVPDVVRRRSHDLWRQQHGVTVATAVAVVFILSCLSIVAAGPLRVQRSAPTNPICTRTIPRVCLWPEDRKYLPVVTAMMQRLNQIPHTGLVIPDTFYESGLRDERRYPYDFLILDGDPWSISSGMWVAIATATFRGTCVPQDRTVANDLAHAYFELDQWVEARLNGEPRPARVHGGPPGVDFGAIGRVIREPEPAQLAWVQSRLKIIHGASCS